MTTLARRAMDVLVAPFLAGALLLLWLPLRLRAFWRRTRGALPVIIWGSTPSIQLPHWSRAVRAYGYASYTVAYTHDALGHPGLFDYYMPRYFPGMLRLFMPYATFLWVLCSADIFHVFFNVAGYLYPTAFRYLELPILRAFGKLIVALPFGSDVQRASVIRGRYRWSIAAYIPSGPAEWAVLRNVRHTLCHANYVITGSEKYVFFPQYDLCAAMVTVDLDSITPSYPEVVPGRPVRILHAPQHRHLKGTEYLICACDRLKAEGLPVELCLVEGIRNDRALEIYRQADIVVEQLIQGGYSLFAIESMALGKPVVAHLYPDAIAANLGWDQCPIVNADPETIAGVLRDLAGDPRRLAALGRASRAYVEKYHSYQYIGGLYDQIYRRLWGHGSSGDGR